MAGSDHAPTDGTQQSAGRDPGAAERMAILAGVSARLASSPASELEGALSESLDDVRITIGANRWLFVFHPGRTVIGANLDDDLIGCVEEALRNGDPVTVKQTGAGTRSAIAAPATIGGSNVGVVVIERDGPDSWETESVALVRAVADVAGAAVARRKVEAHLRRSDSRYQRLLETSGEGVCLLAADATIRFSNRAFSRLVGEARWPLIGQPIVRYIADDSPVLVAARLLHESARVELELLRVDGTHRWVSCATSGLRDDPDDDSCALVMMTDISMRRAAEAALRSSEARFRALVRSSADVIVITDGDGTIVYASPAMRDVLGHDPAALAGTSPLDLVHGDDVDRVERELRELVDAGAGSMIVRCRVRTAAGDHRHVEAAITNLIDDADVSGMTITARDITATVELQANLAHAAMHDGVTGLPNRRMMNQRLTALLRTPDPTVAVLFADLNGFKAVNDGLGHDAGDDVLRAVAKRMQDAVRDGDVVVRHGGDEFAVVCPGVSSSAEAAQIADRIIASMGEGFSVEDRHVDVGVSIGIALSSALPAPVTTTALVAAADSAMYKAKHDRSGWELALQP